MQRSVLETVKRRLSNEQISEILEQRLKDYVILPHPLPDNIVFPQIIDYIEDMRRSLAKLPPYIKDELLKTLVELAPTQKWVLIKDITKRLKERLASAGSHEGKKLSQHKVGHFLRVLGFWKRKRRHEGTAVLVDHDLLRHYGKLANKKFVNGRDKP